jgi:hypothetical protein
MANGPGNFDKSKNFNTNAYPVESHITSSLLRRVEATLTPELLVSRHLKGVPLQDFTSEELKDQIEIALNDFELMSGVPAFKLQYKERIPFDRQAYRAFVYFKLNNGPVLSIESLDIESSNGETIYRLPPAWIEMGLAHKRQINLVPILSIFGAAGLQDGQPTNAGLIFIQAISNFSWLPAFYTVKYTCGLSHIEGQLPVIVNQIIGATAAINILSMKQAQEKYTSTSISQDGLSQSASGLGPKQFTQRIEDLGTERERLLQKLKSEFHQKYYLSNI